jgi:hypothetical protein
MRSATTIVEVLPREVRNFTLVVDKKNVETQHFQKASPKALLDRIAP